MGVGGLIIWQMWRWRPQPAGAILPGLHLFLTTGDGLGGMPDPEAVQGLNLSIVESQQAEPTVGGVRGWRA